MSGCRLTVYAQPHAPTDAAAPMHRPHAAMERMAEDIPQALNVLQVAVMRANTLDLSQAAAQAQGA